MLRFVDAFDVASVNAENNYFKQYSQQGKKHLQSYRYEHKTKDGNIYSFIGIDACPIPGARRPFNFLGVLGQVIQNQTV